jgi:hypothetical protein
MALNVLGDGGDGLIVAAGQLKRGRLFIAIDAGEVGVSDIKGYTKAVCVEVAAAISGQT